MGTMKNMETTIRQRGYGVSDKYICENCIRDEYLAGIICSNGTPGCCDFCSNKIKLDGCQDIYSDVRHDVHRDARRDACNDICRDVRHEVCSDVHRDAGKTDDIQGASAPEVKTKVYSLEKLMFYIRRAIDFYYIPAEDNLIYDHERGDYFGRYITDKYEFVYYILPAYLTENDSLVKNAFELKNYLVIENDFINRNSDIRNSDINPNLLDEIYRMLPDEKMTEREEFEPSEYTEFSYRWSDLKKIVNDIYNDIYTDSKNTDAIINLTPKDIIDRCLAVTEDIKNKEIKNEATAIDNYTDKDNDNDNDNDTDLFIDRQAYIDLKNILDNIIEFLKGADAYTNLSISDDIYRAVNHIKTGEEKNAKTIGTAPSVFAADNRFSAKHDMMFYGAKDKVTAVDEINGHKKSVSKKIIIGVFHPSRDLKLIDLCEIINRPMPSWFDIDNAWRREIHCILNMLAFGVSEPVDDKHLEDNEFGNEELRNYKFENKRLRNYKFENKKLKNNDSAETIYRPLQVLVKYIQLIGIADGLVYKSSLSRSNRSGNSENNSSSNCDSNSNNDSSSGSNSYNSGNNSSSINSTDMCYVIFAENKDCIDRKDYSFTNDSNGNHFMMILDRIE